MKGYELLHRIKQAKGIFMMIKIIADDKNQPYGTGADDQYCFVDVTKESLAKEVNDIVSDTDPPEWGSDVCEFLAVWHNECGEAMIHLFNDDRGYLLDGGTFEKKSSDEGERG
jgi:hypothetical protein